MAYTVWHPCLLCVSGLSLPQCAVQASVQQWSRCAGWLLLVSVLPVWWPQWKDTDSDWFWSLPQIGGTTHVRNYHVHSIEELSFFLLEEERAKLYCQNIRVIYMWQWPGVMLQYNYGKCRVKSITFYWNTCASYLDWKKNFVKWVTLFKLLVLVGSISIVSYLFL